MIWVVLSQMERLYPLSWFLVQFCSVPLESDMHPRIKNSCKNILSVNEDNQGKEVGAPDSLFLQGVELLGSNRLRCRLIASTA